MNHKSFGIVFLIFPNDLLFHPRRRPLLAIRIRALPGHRAATRSYARPLARSTRRASTVMKPRQSASAAGDQDGQLNIQPPSSPWAAARWSRCASIVRASNRRRAIEPGSGAKSSGENVSPSACCAPTAARRNARYRAGNGAASGQRRPDVAMLSVNRRWMIRTRSSPAAGSGPGTC